MLGQGSLVSLQTDDDDDDSKEFPLVRPIHRSLGIDPNHSCPQRLVKYAADDDDETDDN